MKVTFTDEQKCRRFHATVQREPTVTRSKRAEDNLSVEVDAVKPDQIQRLAKQFDGDAQ